MIRPAVVLLALASCEPLRNPIADVSVVPLAEQPPTPFEEAPGPSVALPLDPAIAYAARTPRERTLAVTLDRPLYRPGEVVWARVWDLGTAGLDAKDTKGTVRVELVDGRGSVVEQRLLAHTGAGAHAALDLRSGLAGGLYSVRATVDGRVVERPLVVASFEEPRIRKELDLLRDAYAPGDEVTAALTVASSGRGPLVDHPVQVVVQVDGEALPPIAARTDARGEATLRFTLPQGMRRADAVLTVVVEEEGWSESVSRPIPVVLSEVRAEVFPEGAEALVAGLPGRVYVRVRDTSGMPADAEGVVEDDAGDVVARFRTVHDGLARAAFTPRPGRAYSVRLTGSVRGDAQPVPVAEEGCVLRTWDDFDGQVPEIRAGVWCSEPRTVVLTGSLRGHRMGPTAVEAGPDAPGVVWMTPSSGILAQGVATITASTHGGEPLAERLVYRNRARSLQIAIEPGAATFGPRDAVELKVVARDPDGEPVQADLAVSVVDDRLLKHADDEHGNLLSALYLEPEIRGRPQDPAWYFDPDEPDAGTGLDLVLGTYGWRAFHTDAVAVEANHVQPLIADAAGAPDVWQAPLGGVEPGMGGLLGAVGTQLGAGGLGGRGMGIGGGGIALGLGGLGTRGMGSGASGYGKGGGLFGERSPWGVAAAGQPVIQGSLDRNGIDRVIRQRLSQVRYCYQRQLASQPDLSGKVVVKFTIGSDGAVSQAAIKSTSLRSRQVEDCIVGRFLRMQFPEPKGGGIVIVNYPFLFAPGDGTAAGADVPRHEVERVFAQPDYAGGVPPEHRTDFRSTVGWWPSVKTGVDGTATVKFFLADPVTSWTVTAEGVGGGSAGRAERVIHSTLPFSLDVPLPTEVSFGDRLNLPVRLSNRRGAPATVKLRTHLEGPGQAPLVADDGTETQSITVSPQSGTVTVVPIAVPDVMGSATIEVSADDGTVSDSVKRTLVVAPRGFPHEFQAGGTLHVRADHPLRVESALAGTIEGTVVVYPNPLANLLEGAESMVRMPGGCFEQTSSTNHPNVLVLEYLDATGGGGATRYDRGEVLRTGYQRLTAYQVTGGGFETFGSGPGKEALSAYGLLQFHRMKRVFPEVDPHVTDRDRAYLLASRDGSGGYSNTGSSSHQYGAAPKVVNDAYITWALAQTGDLSAGPELAAQAALAKTTDDPYLLALATATLLARGDGAAAAAERLAGLQAGDGSFPGAKASVESSGGRDLLVETTALAAIALWKADHQPQASAAVRWLGTVRQGTYGWGNTQATVLALEASSLVAMGATTSAGTVVVKVDGEPVGSVAYTGAEKGAVRVSLPLTPGDHVITLIGDGAEPVPYTVEAKWRRDVPADAADAQLALETRLAEDTVALGHTVRLVAAVTNTSAQGVASPIARVRIPAGVRVETRALEDLRDRGHVAQFETRPREVTLYWEGMAPGERREVALDLVAEIPGTFHAPPSVVYPYYTSQAVDWEDGGTLRITP